MITDQDPLLNFSAASYTVSENAGNATITVNLSPSSTQTVTVHYACPSGQSRGV